MLIEPDQDNSKRLIKLESGDFVGVHFGHLDYLIGSLCHVMDLNSDREYREHVKSEIKSRCREWLEQQYRDCGYYVQKEQSITAQGSLKVK